MSGGEQRFNTVDDIWDDIKRYIDRVHKWQETKGVKHTDGQELYGAITKTPYCFQEYILEDWMIEMVQEYIYCTKFNIPVGKDLSSTDSFRLDCFMVISIEFEAVGKYGSK